MVHTHKQPGWCWLLVVGLMLVGALLASAATDTITTPIPSANDSFLSDLQRFLREEDARLFALGSNGFVVSGGTSSGFATLTHTITALTARGGTNATRTTGGNYISQAATAHTYTASRRTYVYAHVDDTTPATFSISGGNGCTFSARDQHLLFVECASGSGEPTAPDDTIRLFFADTSATSITAVTDLRVQTGQGGIFIATNYPSLQAAINAMPASGGALLLPAGTHVLQSELSIASRTRLAILGAGRDRTVIQAGAGSNLEQLVNITGTVSDLLIADLTLDGNGTAQASGSNRGIHLNANATDIVVRDVGFTNFTGTATANSGVGLLLNTGPVERLYVQRAVFTNIKFRAISSDLTNLRRAWITDSYAETTAGGSEVIRIVGQAQHIHFRGNHIRQLALLSPTNFSIIDSVIADNVIDGLGALGQPGDTLFLDTCARVLVSNNIVRNSSDNGFNFGSCTDSIATGNLVNSAQLNGMAIFNSSRISLVGNHIENAGLALQPGWRNGIVIDSQSAATHASDNLIANNYIKDVVGSMVFGIRLLVEGTGVADRNIIRGNYIKDVSGGTDISVEAGEGHVVDHQSIVGGGAATYLRANSSNSQTTHDFAAGRTAIQDVNINLSNGVTGLPIWTLRKAGPSQVFQLRDPVNNRVMMSATPGATSLPNFDSGVVIGGGTAITQHLSGTASLDFAAWAGNDCQQLSFSIVGTIDGDAVALGLQNILANETGVLWSAWIGPAGTANVRGCKVTAGASGNPPASIVRVDVWRH